MEGFEGLTSGFGLNDVDDRLEEIQNDVSLIETKKNEIEQKAKNQIVFQDQEFIRKDLRSLIMSARAIIYKVEQDIKIGTATSKIEAYSKLLESIGKQYQALLELNKSIFDAQVQTGQIDIENIGDNKISLSPEQLLDMVIKANESSQMNAIEADFKVEGEHLPPDEKGDD